MRSWVSRSWCASFALLASNCSSLNFSLSAFSASSLAWATPMVLALSSRMVSGLSPSRRLLGRPSSFLGLEDLGVSSTSVLDFLGVLVSSLEEDVLFLFWVAFSGGMSLRKTVWPPAEPHLLVISAAFNCGLTFFFFFFFGWINMNEKMFNNPLTIFNGTFQYICT